MEDDLRARFLAGMSRAAQTVNIVTTDGPAGRGGVTVSAMTSVSADTEKPTLLVCMHRDSSAAPLILGNGVFCVNVLRDDQMGISDVFAGRHRRPTGLRLDPAERFGHAEWAAMPSGAPRIVDPLVAFDCRMVSADLVGTHHVFFGEVGEVFIADTGSPLIYAQRSYGAAAPIITSPAGGKGAETGDRLLLAVAGIADPLLPRILHRFRQVQPETAITLIEGKQARVQAALMSGEAELALMEDPGLVAGLGRQMVAELGLHALIPADDPLAGKAVIGPEDLKERPLILCTSDAEPEQLRALLQENGVELRIVSTAESAATAWRLVEAGLGIALIAAPPPEPEQGADGSSVTLRPLSFDMPAVRLALVHHVAAAPSPTAEVFMRICREVLR